MVKLTDAILKAQQGTQSNNQRTNSRERTTSQNSRLAAQDKSNNLLIKNSKKQAPISITGDKLSLNYQEITSLQIDRQGLAQTQQSALAFQFAKVKKLFLSHNNLQSLDGIENFANLTHLSISHNKLMSVDELAKIGAQSLLHGAGNNAGKLQCLAVKGNFFLERHPDCRALIIRHFTGLRELDSQPLMNPSGPNTLSLRGQVREGTHLKHLLVPFILKLDRSLQFLTAHLDGTVGSQVDRIELVQKWTQVFNHKDFAQRSKIPQRSIAASQLKSFIKSVDGTLNSGSQQSMATALKVQRKELYDLFQWLYQEIILKLSTQLKSTDLVKFLNYKILQKYPQLADFLNVKNQVDSSKSISQMDQRQIDRLCSLLERDQQISLEMLLAEQLNVFYELQPELSTIQDMSSEIAGIEVIENVHHDDGSMQEHTMTSETQRMVNQIASAVLHARGANSRSSSPNTLGGTRRMVVENSGGSALDHPVILQNQRELINRSLNPQGTTVEDTEFSFREKQEQHSNDTVGLQKFSPQKGNSMNEQSFLVGSRVKTEQSGVKDKHSESPVRRSEKPVMKSFFKIKQSEDTEILPSRDSQQDGTMLSDNMQMMDQQKPVMASLKMNIPKNYFNQDLQSVNAADKGGLGPDMLLSKIHTRNDVTTISDSFQLSGNDPIIAARGQYQAQPEQQMVNQESRKILARFLEDQNDEAALRETRNYLKDKVLTQFPIFALNEDYMRALTLIIIDKIERAQSLINQLGTQIFQQQQDKRSAEDSSLQSSAASAPKTKLTEAEKEKLTIIKRKLKERKLQSVVVAQERNSTRSRSVTFSEQCLSKSRSRSRGISSKSQDSCFSPVHRRRQHSGKRSQSGSLIRQNQQQTVAQTESQQKRVYASGVLREQSLEHQRLTDEQNAQQWVKKKQTRQLFAQKIKRICLKLDLAEERTKQQALNQWIRFAQRLHILEHQLRSKQQAVHKQKALYFWMAAYQQSADLTRGLRTLQIKQKVWYQLVINHKQAQLGRAKVDTYYRQKLLLKSFYGFLKILEMRRESRRKQQSEERQQMKQKVAAKQQKQAKKQQKSVEQKILLQSPPVTETQNKFKRSGGSKSKKKSTSKRGDDGRGLGLINVNPIIDKQIDGVYDLDIVDVQRQSLEQAQISQGRQPLLNAVNSQQVFENYNEELTAIEGIHQNVTSITFSDQKLVHGHTNAQLKTQKSQRQDDSAQPVPSAYFTKQVNFFKTGGVSSGKSFVQERNTITNQLRRSQSREESRLNKSSHSASRNNNTNRSNSRDHSLNRSKRSILKKVYGGTAENEQSMTKAPQLKWSIQQQTQTEEIARELMTNASVQADLSLNNSFGKLMADRVTKQNETSSYLEVDIASKTIASGQSSGEKPKRKSSKGSKNKRKNQSRDRVGNQSDMLLLGHSRTEQNSLISFRPSQVYTTQAKARQRPTRGNSRSQERGLRMNCGNLSRSIQDQEPKGYEKTTVSFVSKFIPGQQQQKQGGTDATGQQQTSSSQMFKHLKNATMGGNGDFFKTSASNKKLYQKLLVK